jgi:hypothetical protein
MEDNIILTPRFIEYVQEYTRTFAYYSFEVIISFVTFTTLKGLGGQCPQTIMNLVI